MYKIIKERLSLIMQYDHLYSHFYSLKASATRERRVFEIAINSRIWGFILRYWDNTHSAPLYLRHTHHHLAVFNWDASELQLMDQMKRSWSVLTFLFAYCTLEWLELFAFYKLLKFKVDLVVSSHPCDHFFSPSLRFAILKWKLLCA